MNENEYEGSLSELYDQLLDEEEAYIKSQLDSRNYMNDMDGI